MDLRPGIIEKHPLESIIKIATKKTLFISNIVLSVGLTSQFKDIPKLYLISIKVIIVLVILCYLTH